MSDTSEAGTAVDLRVTDTAIRLGLLYLLAAWCIQIVTPFATILIWEIGRAHV